MTPSHRLRGHPPRGHAPRAVAGVLVLACLAMPAIGQQPRSQGTTSEAAVGKPPGATRSILPLDRLSQIEGSNDEWSVSRSDAGCYLMSPRRKSTSRLAIGRHPTLGVGLFAVSFALALAGEGAVEPVVIRASGRELARPGRTVAPNLLLVKLDATEVEACLAELREQGVLWLGIRNAWLAHGGRGVDAAVAQYGRECTQ
jgi:hypothetical protein